MHWAECDNYIFTFFAGDLMVFLFGFFFLALQKKSRAAPAMYLNKHDCCASEAFYSQGKTKLYI